MNSWILGGLVVAAILIAIRIYFAGRSATKSSDFLQDRPLPDLSPPNDPGDVGQTDQSRQLKAGLERLAVPPEPAPLNPATDVRPQPPLAASVAPPVPPGPPLMPPLRPEPVGSQGSSAKQTPTNRISTWHNRRLFSDFQGILAEGGQPLSRIVPEELPISSDAMIFGGLTPAIAQLLPESAERREVQRKNLLGAGYHSRASWLNLTAIRFVLAFLSLVIVGFWLVTSPPEFEVLLLALVVIAPLIMWALPPLIVAMKSGERKIDIERGLPDLLDMLNMGVSQGLTVPQALRRISQEIAPAHPALAEELRIVNHQADIGTLPQALKNFSQRIDSPEVSSFTSLLIQSEATGTSVSRALTDYSDSIRSTLKERADSRANAASFKLLFPVALCLMPSVFLFLLGPAIVEMSDFFGTRAEALDTDRQDALDRLQQSPRPDLTRF